MDYLIQHWQLILGVAAVMAAYITFILLPQMKKNDMKNVYQSLAEPRVLIQYSEHETDYTARYERERMRYLDSKNRIAIIQTPIIYFPINAAFEVEWFGEKHYPSTIGMSYDEYQMAAIAFQRMLKAIWFKKLYGEFGTQKMMEITRNQAPPPTPNEIWTKEYTH